MASLNAETVMASNFYTVPGGHPPQSQLLTGRAVFKTAYAFIPKDVMKDIVASLFPFWDKTRGWVLARDCWEHCKGNVQLGRHSRPSKRLLTLASRTGKRVRNCKRRRCVVN